MRSNKNKRSVNAKRHAQKAKHELASSIDRKIRFTFINHRQMRRRNENLSSTENDHLNEESILRGILNIHNLLKNEEWVREFRSKHPHSIEISDNLCIKFDRFHRNQTFEILVRNNMWRNVTLKTVSIGLPSVKLCNYFNEKTVIEPSGKLKLSFEARFVSNKCSDQALIHFVFGKRTVVKRTIHIVYQKKGPIIPRQLYENPDELIKLIDSQFRISSVQLKDSLDQWVPTLNENYLKHFHNLVHLEEIGLRKEIRDKYSQREAYFGVQEYSKENGHDIRKKYKPGVYDLTVNGLFESRPSLQLGDKIIARKHSAPERLYEGYLIDIKENDLIVVEFKDDFISTFDHTAYMINFDFSRVPWKRMHYAIDVAYDSFGTELLIPGKVVEREKCLVDVRLNENEQMVVNETNVINWFNTSLNEHQKQTVANVLKGDLLNPYLINGPPGTGKTTTLTEIVLQILMNINQSKIVIATQSNSAANLIVQRLIKFREVNSDNLLRIISFTYANRSNVIPEEIEDFVSTIDDLSPDKDAKMFQRLQMVKRYRIVVGTSSTISNFLEINSLREHFTHAVIDESGQSSEVGALIPMALVGKEGQTIMAGDPLQMAPLVINFHANTRGLSISMLSRLLECYSNIDNSVDDSRLVSKLFRNYRSLPSILDFYNTQFYGSALIPMISASGSREAKLLEHLNTIFDLNYGNDYGIHFVNVEGQDEKRKHSWWNFAEVHVIKALVEKIMKLGMNSDYVGIITPYALQARAIESVLKKYPDIKVGTVEDFQGLERKVVLLSTVRTCRGRMTVDIHRRLGFVKCPKRMNVALSRARAMVIVVGKAKLLSNDENWNALIERCKENKTFKYASVPEE